MELIVYYLNQGLSFIIPLVILLGLLIFVHELGHFLVAKFYGVRVEVFSLGFGKKFFKYKKGDTEYCLSVIPFGGYVKMYGDDPTAEIPEENKKFSFTHKPVGQRIGVVLAGPLMNLFFAAFLFFIIAMVGEEVVSPVVGDISPKSAAYSFGLRPEDEITAINNQSVQDWNQVKEYIESNGSGPIQLTIKRPNQTETINIQARTELIQNPNVLSSDDEVGDIEGLSYLFRASAVAVQTDSSLAAKSGIKSGDHIVAVNGQPISRWNELVRAVATAEASGQIELKVQRPGERNKIETVEAKFLFSDLNLNKIETANLDERGKDVIAALGLDQPDLYASNILDGSAASQGGLKVGDKIVSVNGEISEWQDLVNTVQSYKENSPPLKVAVIRDNKRYDFDLVPQKILQPTPTGKEKEVYAIGIVAGVVNAPPLTFIERVSNPAKALAKGIKDAGVWSKNTALSFLRLLQNRVSAKSIGGPIMIGQLASKTFEVGLSPFLKIMAIISINLFILNLLPVPVLDGGHLVFFTIEALRGAPLSMRKMEIAQQVGLVLLMSLMVLAIFNDVSRLFN